MTDLPSASQIEMQADAQKIVHAFDMFYDLHGSEAAVGLIAGLIKYKEQLDREQTQHGKNLSHIN